MNRYLTIIFTSVLFSQALFLGVEAEEELSPSRSLRRLQLGNERYVEEIAIRSGKRTELLKGQTPIATVLTCADSRIQPAQIFGEKDPGKLFVVREAGNTIDPITLASIEFSVEALNVPLVVVLGHEHCGAVEAAFNDGKPFSDNLLALVKKIRPAVQKVEESHPNSPQQELLSLAIKQNVIQSVEQMLDQSPIIKDHLEQGKIKIVAGVYQFGTGRIAWIPQEER